MQTPFLILIGDSNKISGRSVIQLCFSCVFRNPYLFLQYGSCETGDQENREHNETDKLPSQNVEMVSSRKLMNCRFFVTSALLLSCSLLLFVLYSFLSKLGIYCHLRLLVHEHYHIVILLSWELEQEVCRLQQQLQMAEEELRRYEPDPVRFTSMEDYEVCEKQLLDTLTHVVQRSWLPENEHNQSHLFDASANSNQLRELSLPMYEPLLQAQVLTKTT
uniref:Uncharacterized protein n=1 Tax=Brassica oleracea var. oleracea TaxID=109376 RepID=A0A0D3CCB9_BRAOL